MNGPACMQAGNVLLKTHRIDRRGYIAKVADFGTGLSYPVFPSMLCMTMASGHVHPGHNVPGVDITITTLALLSRVHCT